MGLRKRYISETFFCIFVLVMTTDQSLQQLFSHRAWHKHTGIRESTARIYRKRFKENRLELETKIKILNTSGYRLVRDMEWEPEVDRSSLKAILTEKLVRSKVFWSFEPNSTECLPDELLIEKVLLYLDIEEISSMFLLFPPKKIRKVWREKMVSQEPMYHAVNRLFAFLFFGIKNPDSYIRQFLKKRKNEFHEGVVSTD